MTTNQRESEKHQEQCQTDKRSLEDCSDPQRACRQVHAVHGEAIVKAAMAARAEAERASTGAEVSGGATAAGQADAGALTGGSFGTFESLGAPFFPLPLPFARPPACP